MMLFFLCISIIILCLFLIFLTINFNILIERLDIDTSKEKIFNNYEFKFQINILRWIPIFSIRLNEKKLNQIKESKLIERLSNIDFKKISSKIEKRLYKEYENKDLLRLGIYVLKKIKPEIALFKLYLELGLDDIFLTIYSIPIISVLIAAILKYGNIDKNIKRTRDKYEYKIMPVYNKYKVNLKLDCIISIKLVHIINIIYNFLVKQRRRDINGRTSYRRSYGYSHE